MCFSKLYEVVSFSLCFFSLIILSWKSSFICRLGSYIEEWISHGAILTSNSMVSTLDFMSYFHLIAIIYNILWNNKREPINVGFDSSVSSHEKAFLKPKVEKLKLF